MGIFSLCIKAELRIPVAYRYIFIHVVTIVSCS